MKTIAMESAFSESREFWNSRHLQLEQVYIKRRTATQILAVERRLNRTFNERHSNQALPYPSASRISLQEKWNSPSSDHDSESSRKTAKFLFPFFTIGSRWRPKKPLLRTNACWTSTKYNESNNNAIHLEFDSPLLFLHNIQGVPK